MSKLILPKATSAQREAATPVEGDLLYDVDKKSLYFGDGAHQGGVAIGVAHDTPFVYGLDYDTSIATASAACKKVVLNHSHDTLGDALRYTVVDDFMAMPAHNFRRCVMDDLATRHVNYYLNASDSTKKEDGTSAVLTGGDGDVMVEIPVTYYRIDHYTDASDNEHIVWLVSDKQFTGSVPHEFFYVSPGGNTLRTQYVGAYKSVLCEANGAPVDTTESSATPATFSAGRRMRSIAGAKLFTSAWSNQFRPAASNNGGRLANGLFHRYLAMMMAIEGGTFDTEAAFGSGFSRANESNYAFIRLTGRCNYGNGTGEILADADRDAAIVWATGTTDAQKVIQWQYRGIENPFGESSTIYDALVATANGYAYTTDVDSYANEASYLQKAHAWAANNGYISDFAPDTFFAKGTTGSSSTYLTDKYQNIRTHDTASIVCGGAMRSAGEGGIFFTSVTTSVGYPNPLHGFRLAC